MTRIADIPTAALSGLKAAEAPAANRPSGFALRNLKHQLAGEAITTKHLLMITSQLAVMLSSGCDLVAGLEAMKRQAVHGRMGRVMSDLADGVRQGQAFSQALARHPDVFDPLYVAMVRAGEQAGMLKQMLQALVVMLRNQIRIVGAVRSALLYPAVLTTVAISAIVVMTTFVLPRFAKVFEQNRVALPLPTQMVLNASGWLYAHMLAVAIGLVFFAAFILWLTRRPPVKRVIDAWSLKAPLVGPALKLAAVCRSIQTIGSMAKSGLPLADALLLTRDLMSNVHYWEFFDRLNHHITEGKPLSADFEKTELFPPMVTQMISVGEQTGTLSNVCLEVASYHEEELHARIKVLTTAIEPIIIVSLGGFVGFLAVSVILPMFRIASAVH